MNNRHDDNDDYEHIDRGVQGITIAEEMREFSALSAEEMVAVQADLIGLSTAMGSLNIQAAATTSSSNSTSDKQGHKRAKTTASPSSSTLFTARQQQHEQNASSTEQFGRLAEELGRLPPEETAACRRALEMCPDQVLNPRRIQMFLEYALEEEQRQSHASVPGRSGMADTCGGNGNISNNINVSSESVQKAASQLAEYWRARENFFNSAHPNTAFLPMTQAGALTAPGAMELARRQIWQLLPQTDVSGRSILYFVPSRKNYSEHTFYDELAGLWYLIETVMEDPDKRKCGLVMLMDCRDYSRQHTSRGAFFGLMDLLSALPISLKALHACYPSALVHHIIFPIYKRLAPKDMRLRTVLHYGSVSEVLTSLSGYCLPPECVPTDLGGQLVVDGPSWMLSRLAAETATMNPSIGTAVENNIEAANLLIPVSEVATEPVDEEAAAASKGGDDNHSSSNNGGDDTSPPDVDHHPNLTDRQVYERIMEKKEKTLGSKGDPRMNHTLLICLEDPNLPHLDVLLQCGFDFAPLSREELELKGSREVKDVENITLKQRFDQLSRRLRTARKWIERERKEGNLLLDPSCTTSATGKAAGKFRSDTSESGHSNTSGDASNGSRKRDMAPEQTQKSRRDSFDEAIEELPGMEDLGDTIGEVLSDEEYSTGS